MSLSSYPLGVTGRESAIAGDDFERDELRYVDECNYYLDDCTFAGGDVEGTLYGDYAVATFAWECPGCGREYTKEIYPED